MEVDLDNDIEAVEQLRKYRLVEKLVSEKILNKTGIIKITKSSWCTESTFSVAA